MIKKYNDKFVFSKYQIAVTAFFLATNFTYFTMAPRILLIFGYPQPGGILVFPFTFLLSDIITENYGYDYAKFCIFTVIAMFGFFTFGTWVSMKVPTYLDYGYAGIFNHYPKLFISISIATVVAFFVNNAIVSKLKIKWDGRFFWLRSLIATSVGHAIFSSIWILMYHNKEVEFSYLLKMIICMYIFKMSCEIVGMPFASKISKWIKKKEGIDPYDRNVNYNPFKL